jgi:hypothetical protein
VTPAASTKLVSSAGRLFGLRFTDGIAISAAAYILAGERSGQVRIDGSGLAGLGVPSAASRALESAALAPSTPARAARSASGSVEVRPASASTATIRPAMAVRSSRIDPALASSGARRARLYSC